MLGEICRTKPLGIRKHRGDFVIFGKAVRLLKTNGNNPRLLIGLRSLCCKMRPASVRRRAGASLSHRAKELMTAYSED